MVKNSRNRNLALETAEKRARGGENLPRKDFSDIPLGNMVGLSCCVERGAMGGEG